MKKTRPYNQTRRAEQQAATGQRIVEAAVALHGELGPARTTTSMVAERAGVQRHTVYAHFPDERSLFLACSGLALERSPLPDAEPWGKIASTGERLRAGLSALYEWFEQNEALAGCVLRDAEFHPLTKEITRLRIEPHMRRYQRILEAGFNMRQRALLRVALAFHTWRTLAREGGLAREDAVATMVDAIERQAA